jgi:xylulokinase
VTECREPGLLGAAVVAWRAVGRIGSLAEGQDRFVRLARRHEPDPLAQAGYSQLYDLFKAAEKAVLPISEELAKWSLPLSMHRPERSQE